MMVYAMSAWMTPIYEIEDAVAQLTLVEGLQANQVVEKVAKMFPDVFADLLHFAFVTNAYELQETYFASDETTSELGANLYKFAAIFACDVAAVRAIGSNNPTGQDLIDFWISTSGGSFVGQSV